MLLLGIETSCDETGVALAEFGGGRRPAVLCEKLASQERVHEAYGGVVPELAAREHLRNLPYLVHALCSDGGVSLRDVAAVGVTRGPGLKGCLLIGFCFAKGLAAAGGLPLIGVNHIEAHVHTAMLDNPDLDYPFLALIVSGGHTEIVEVLGLGRYRLLARTIDDAAGEAFDKSANLLGFPYPGGARLAALADSCSGSPFSLPRVMRDSPGFSFSGLKTAIALLIEEQGGRAANQDVRAALAFAIQEAIVDALCWKLKRAAGASGLNRVAVVGGVSANRCLRERVAGLKGVKAYFPQLRHCVDNGAMAAYLAALRLLAGERTEIEVDVLARWPIEEQAG